MDTRFKVVIVPHNLDLENAPTYDESLFGAAFSTTRQIVVNEVEDGYSILYRDQEFVKLDMESMARQLVDSINRNFPTINVEINLFYFFYNRLWERCGEEVCKLDNIFDEYADAVDGNITYERTQFVDELYDRLGYEDAEDDDTDDDDVGDVEDGVCSPDEVVDLLRKMTGYNGSSQLEDDDDDDDYYPRRRKTEKKRYGTSSVLRSAKKVKRTIRRHNIIICSDKAARKRDKKIIRQMARDFIKPGNSRLMRDFCNDVARRWFDEFVISKKVAKRLMKAHKKESRGKHEEKESHRALNVTRTILKAVDPFYDPKH